MSLAPGAAQNVQGFDAPAVFILARIAPAVELLVMETDDLSSKLRKWQPEAQIPPRFQAEVWQRIAARQETRQRSIWNWFREGLWVELGKPQYATALIAASVALSLGAAHLNAAQANARNWRTLETRYVSSVTPLGQIGQPR